MKFAFAGTPEFGAQVLRDLLDRHLRPVMVISQPDRPAGRGRTAAAPAVVTAARAAGLAVTQTADINSPAISAALQEAGAECLVVAAFGQLLRADLLSTFLCVNVHASLLPAYRGAAPIVRALMAGEGQTGVSLMRMTAGLDEGPWVLQRRVSITARDDAGTVGRALALLGALAVAEVLEGVDDDTVTWNDQSGASTYAAKVGPSDRVFDPRLDARRLHDRVRALSPGIGCEARSVGGLSLKVWRTWPREVPAAGQTAREAAPDLAPAGEGAQAEPGRLTREDGRLFVECGSGRLELLTLQPAGKRPMRTAEFLRGYSTRLGGRLEMPPGGGWERQK